MKDNVNHPDHYTQGGLETIEIIKEVASKYTGFEASLVGNVVKYIDRANFKDNKLQDLQKARWYLDRLIKEVEQ